MRRNRSLPAHSKRLILWPETMWRWGLLEIDPAEPSHRHGGPEARNRCRRTDNHGHDGHTGASLSLHGGSPRRLRHANPITRILADCIARTDGTQLAATAHAWRACIG